MTSHSKRASGSAFTEDQASVPAPTVRSSDPSSHLDSGDVGTHGITLVIYNARVWTADPDKPKASAVAFGRPATASTSGNGNAAHSSLTHKGAVVVAVGNDEEILALASPQTRLHDAKQQFLCPGFIDSHIHFWMGGARLVGVQLNGCKSATEFVERIRDFALTIPKGEWIYGGDWDHQQVRPSCVVWLLQRNADTLSRMTFFFFWYMIVGCSQASRQAND